MRQKKIKKIWVFLLIYLLIFLQFPYISAAADLETAPDIITPNDVSSGVTSAQSKQIGPQMQVTFNPQSPQAGQVVTATATTQGFVTDKLYYTWYLKKDGCALDDTPSDSVENKCDLDGDKKITVNDWKIAAARIIVAGNFNYKDVTYPSKLSDDTIKNSGNEANPDLDTWKRTWNPDLTNDSDAPNCYIQDFSSGKFYELRKTDAQFSCPSGTHRACVSDHAQSCEIPNPAYQDWVDNGSQGTPPPQTITQSDPICQETSADIAHDDLSDPKIMRCTIANDYDAENFIASSTCAKSGEYPVCLNDSGNTNFLNQGSLVGSIFSKDNDVCSSLGGGTVKNVACKSSAIASLETVPACSFKKSDNMCRHLFPYFPKDTKPLLDGKQLDMSDEKTGDGKFTLNEKKFWQADPNVTSTAGNGNTDEANVEGLGVNTFSWVFNPGDEVGVAAEGPTSIPTKHTDSSYITTWAFSKNSCSAFTDNIDGNKKFYVESANATDKIGILTASKFNLDNCLEENLVDPRDSGSGTLSVDLSVDPQDAVNDPNGTADVSRGDIVTANAKISNVGDASSYYYEWKIEASGDGTVAPANDKWVNVTNKISDHTTFEGTGASTLKFKLSIPKNGFPDPSLEKQVLRVRVIVTESNGTDSVRYGRQSKYVNIRSLDRDSVVHIVNITNGSLSLGSPICNNVTDRESCPVLENEIIGMEIPNTDKKYSTFKWTLDGKPLSCSANMSAQCGADNKSSVIFFPAVAVDSDTFTVKVQASADATSIPQEFTQDFKIVDPKVRIGSADLSTVWPEEYGTYKTLNGARTPALSSIIYDAKENTTAKIKAYTTPSWLADRAEKEWNVNGAVFPEDPVTHILMVPIGSAGETTGISLSVSYEPPAQALVALKKFWNVSGDSSIQDAMQAYLQVESVNSQTGGVGAMSTPKRTMANLISNFPAQTLFLIRLLLTSVLLVVITGIVFSLMPQSWQED